MHGARPAQLSAGATVPPSSTLQADSAPLATDRSGGALEVGFHDSTLGWLSVAAGADSSGNVHAALTAHNPAASGAVAGLLPGLQHFLQSENVSLRTVTAAVSANPDALPAAAASTSAGLGNMSGQDQPSGFSPQQQDQARQQGNPQAFTGQPDGPGNGRSRPDSSTGAVLGPQAATHATSTSIRFGPRSASTGFAGAASTISVRV